MRSALITLSALLLSATILVAGNGLQNTLLAVRGNLEGFSLLQIGLLLSVYYVGFILGCQLVPRWVKRVGHVRCFTALASIASASALTHALWVDAVAWLLLRGVTGFCLAGLTMIIESWINERATNQNRGRVLAVYRIVDFGALTVGQFLLTLADPQGFVLFALTSILIASRRSCSETPRSRAEACQGSIRHNAPQDSHSPRSSSNSPCPASASGAPNTASAPALTTSHS